MLVTKRDKETISQLEETQEALRVSIEETKKLARQAERLIKRHKKELGDERR